MALTETKMGSFLRLIQREAYPFLAQRASFLAFFSLYRAEKLTGHKRPWWWKIYYFKDEKSKQKQRFREVPTIE